MFHLTIIDDGTETKYLDVLDERKTEKIMHVLIMAGFCVKKDIV